MSILDLFRRRDYYNPQTQCLVGERQPYQAQQPTECANPEWREGEGHQVYRDLPPGEDPVDYYTTHTSTANLGRELEANFRREWERGWFGQHGFKLAEDGSPDDNVVEGKWH